MNEIVVGIDLGTTNSELAVLRDGQVQVVNIHGQPIMPSCVGIDPSGHLIVGQTARNQLVASPGSTILSIKRRMGENVKVSLGEKSFAPEEISAFILKELKKEGERELGGSIAKAVITVPAFFNEQQRKATQVAGELAGLQVMRIINEPTAAALAYGAARTDDETMLVYDLGGGTFDVSLVVVEKGVVEVKASHGDTRLGGDDFDQLLVDHAVAEFKKVHGVDLASNPQALRRLKVVLERAKCRLSDEPFVAVREEYLDSQHHLEMEIRRDAYEAMIAPLLEKTLDCLHQSLKDANRLPGDIDKVMLVGGATRTPLIQRMLQDRLNLEPRFEINPDLIVAMGAAIQAGVIAGEQPHSILVDITPHTFSTVSYATHDGFPHLICVPIIPRNTPLPASKAEMFYTMVDQQPMAEISVCQGENPLPEQNTAIGEFRIEGLSPVPAGNPIVIHYALDLNGMIQVTATEKTTGLAKTVTMDTRGKAALDIQEARRNIASLSGDPESVAPASPEAPIGDADTLSNSEELVSTAKDLRKRAETLLQKNISVEDKTEIQEILGRVAGAIAERNWTVLEEKNNALSDLLFYLED